MGTGGRRQSGTASVGGAHVPANDDRKSAIVTVPDRKTVQRQREQQQMAKLMSWPPRTSPERQREALQMIVLQEQSYEDAAEATGCAIGTLKSRVHRARLQLRAFLSGERVADAA